MPCVFITGAGRGIGLEFARQYAADGWRVIATCRRPDAAPELATLRGEVDVHALDVTDDRRIEELAEELAGAAIDLLINNAGVLHRGDSFGHTDPVHWAETFRVNAIAPVRVTERLLAPLERGKRKLVVAISSSMGSIADNTSGGYYGYRSSKAALNMAMKSLAVDLAPRGITVALFHPGWVKTDMGGPGATLKARDSVAGMRRKIEALTPADSGKFFRYDGSPLPW